MATSSTSTSERRYTPRRELQRPCALERQRYGGQSSIMAKTIDVGTGGMRICADRPLSVDESLAFDLDLGADGHVEGRARVLREQGGGVYALRFERLAAGSDERLSRAVQTA